MCCCYMRLLRRGGPLGESQSSLVEADEVLNGIGVGLRKKPKDPEDEPGRSGMPRTGLTDVPEYVIGVGLRKSIG